MLKTIMIWIGLVFGLALLIALAWFFTTPQFGQQPSDAQRAVYALTDHHDGSTFINHEQTSIQMDASRIWEVIKEFTSPVDNIKPAREIIPDPLTLQPKSDTYPTRVTWFGHSAFLVEMNGMRILLDPMFGQQAAPHPWLGTNRYNPTFPLEVSQLESIDVVLFSHDHYDHLDHGSVMELKDKVQHWLVPLGVDNHLKSWGVDSNAITAMDWWEEKPINDVIFALTPSRHFSGRGITDSKQTLWGSWVINGDSANIYFSGDGGYGAHFKEIGDKYGPFDLGLIECGQYNYKWADIHMMPEESVQAAIDVQAEVMMPIHWGAFTLSVHSWVEPVLRSSAEAEKLGQSMSTPRIGEPIIISESYPQTAWWLDYLKAPI